MWDLLNMVVAGTVIAIIAWLMSIAVERVREREGEREKNACQLMDNSMMSNPRRLLRHTQCLFSYFLIYLNNLSFTVTTPHPPIATCKSQVHKIWFWTGKHGLLWILHTCIFVPFTIGFGFLSWNMYFLPSLDIPMTDCHIWMMKCSILLHEIGSLYKLTTSM